MQRSGVKDGPDELVKEYCPGKGFRVKDDFVQEHCPRKGFRVSDGPDDLVKERCPGKGFRVSGPSKHQRMSNGEL